MIDLFIQPFVDFDFMRRAWFGCIIISLGASPLGVFLMLRRMSLAGDATRRAHCCRPETARCGCGKRARAGAPPPAPAWPRPN